MRPGLFYSFILIIIPAVLLMRFDVRKGYDQARAGKSAHGAKTSSEDATAQA
jgi:hypothetical protein